MCDVFTVYCPVCKDCGTPSNDPLEAIDNWNYERLIEHHPDDQEFVEIVFNTMRDYNDNGLHEYTVKKYLSRVKERGIA